MTDPIELPCPPPPRPRGGQHGNRNAFKHGFYARTFPSSEVKDLETYTFQGLQEEIAALRLLNRRAIQRAFLLAEDDLAFQDAARVVIGLTVALNTTLRTQIELDLHGGGELDDALKQALQDVAKELGLDPVGN
jgi:hypothetical protein